MTSTITLTKPTIVKSVETCLANEVVKKRRIDTRLERGVTHRCSVSLRSRPYIKSPVDCWHKLEEVYILDVCKESNGI
jgi:hypothetical protein